MARTPTQKHKLPWQTNSVNALLPFNASISLPWGAVCTAEQRVASQSSKLTQPSLLLVHWWRAEELQRVAEKMKGDTFHEALAWNLPEVFERSEPANAPRYAESQRAAAERQQSGRAGQIGERQRGSEMETETETDVVKRDTAAISNLATPHLCKSHLIFPFTYF